MKLVSVKLSEFAELTGYLHEPNPAMGNIETYPAILVVPGGGFRFCSPVESEPVALQYFAEGFQAFTLKYTTVTDVPGGKIDLALRDNQLALSEIRAHASEWHVKPGQLAQIGFSGGSHLSAANAVHGPERPNLLLLGYPGILHSDLRAMECPDIIENVNENTPQTFIFTTRDDNVTPPRHALAFAHALDEAGIGFELHIFRHGPHGMSLGKALTSNGDKSQVNPSFARWFDLSVAWIKDLFGEFTIYGVNDGRFGTYSIDATLDVILENDEARALLLKYLPGSNQVPDHYKLWLTPRKMAEFSGNVPKDILNMLDEELLKL